MVSGMSGTAAAADKDIVDKGAQPIAYDISPANDGTNIAIGKNAKVFIGGGTQESMLSFGETVHEGFFSMHIRDNNHAKQNLPEAIAVGTNSYARTGAIEIGAHTLAENQIAIGDTTADKLRQFGVASTTLGTNSYTGGGFATTIGSYNVQTSPYEAKDYGDTLTNATKNAFSTVIGTFNSNESMTGSSSSGVANMISGMANKVTNSNGAIVMGAGNSVKESSSYIDASPYSTHFDSVADMQKALMDGVASSAGGATLVIGGANSAEKTQNSQIMGVGNSMKSTTNKKVQYNYLDGFNSSITDASHVKVLGQGVTINKGADSNTVIGDYRTVADGQTHNVIIGNADEKAPLTTSHKETVILGFNANASFNGSVALGAGSLADTEAGIFGWDPGTQQASTLDSPVWKSSWAAVSVGDSTHTRQITRVAAGSADTDAVNVAQLKAAMENAAPKLELLAGDGIKIEKDSAGKRYTISANLTGGETATDSTKVEPKTEGTGSGSGDSQETVPGNGKPLEILAETKATKFAADEGSAAVKPSETLHVAGDGKNLSTKVEGNILSVNLKKDLAVDSVTAGGTKLSSDGVTIAGGPSMTKDGLDAGSKKITNVAAGTEETDGVNYGQLKGVENRVEENTRNINQVNGRVSKLDSRLNKVGAGAAALAALHPQDFNPDDKWDFAVGFGNYRDANAMALGAFYRPDDRTMFSVAGNFGNGENMVNAGISVKLGKNSPYAGMDRQAMIHRLASQDRELEAQNQRIAKLEQLVAQLMAK
ncbi:YadA-like family protein [Acidaminococcus timonensis]|uniref:YadA-like family protein n=1 Tax=Acidaminococcus timonensis TaxID=1871002 RepID=UPI00307EFBE0